MAGRGSNGPPQEKSSRAMSEYLVMADTLHHLMEREWEEEEDFQALEFAMVGDLATWKFHVGTHEPYRWAVLTVTERAFDEFDPGDRVRKVLDELNSHDWKQQLRDVRYEDGVELRLGHYGQYLLLRRVPATED